MVLPRVPAGLGRLSITSSNTRYPSLRTFRWRSTGSSASKSLRLMFLVSVFGRWPFALRPICSLDPQLFAATPWTIQRGEQGDCHAQPWAFERALKVTRPLSETFRAKSRSSSRKAGASTKSAAMRSLAGGRQQHGRPRQDFRKHNRCAPARERTCKSASILPIGLAVWDCAKSRRPGMSCSGTEVRRAASC
jgi:hypothetical protein